MNNNTQITPQFKKLFVLTGIGWAFDALDVIIISSVIAALKVAWADDPSQLALIPNIVSVGFVGMAIGAAFGGTLADKFGRKPVFSLTLLIYGLATGFSALAGTAFILVILRFFVGLGLGAELPVASTMVSEAAPKHIRGRAIVLLESFWAIGAILAALIGYIVIPAFGANGWRIALAIGAIPAVWAFVVRRNVPESKRFEDIEKSSNKGNFLKLWSKDYRKRTVAIWLTWFTVNFAYYGAFTWMPTLLLGRGFSLQKSLGYTLAITIAQLPGYFASAYLIEKWGRRATLSAFLLGSAIFAAAFAFAGSDSQIMIFGMCLSFFNLGAWGALYAVSPEIYPTFLRGTGSGWAAGFGRVASIIAPFVVAATSAVAGFGFALTFGLFAAVFVLAAISALFLPELKGTELDG